MLRDWAKCAGFAAVLAVALSMSLLWAFPDDRTSTDTLLAAFTGILAVATIALIFVGYNQGKQLKRAVDSAEQSDEMLQRAYLWPGYGLLILDQEGTRFGIHLGIRNTGRTHGIVKTVHYAIMSKEAFEESKIITYSVFDGREDVIIPDPAMEARSGVWHRLSGMPKVSCGWVTYKDVLGKIRRQGYKYLVHANGRSDSLPDCFTYEPWNTEYEERVSEQEPLPANVKTVQIKNGEPE